ncbi:hypothetical protein B0H19DRAFT_1286043 [Mycena capillaripes]|nr:hypothetical protein B0H19DRAFT_1286043 [Mycena capillaripes]
MLPESGMRSSLGKKWNIIESIVCKEGEEDPADRIIVQARLRQIFEVPHDRDVPTAGASPRKRITIVKDEDITEPRTTDEICLSFRLCLALEKSKLVHREYRDMEGNLISPADLNSKLTEGTLVLVMLKFATNIMKDHNKKVYYILIDKLRILDHGDSEPFVASKSAPVAPDDRSPMTPTKRAHDDAADSAFDSFASNATPSPPKRTKRKA